MSRQAVVTAEVAAVASAKQAGFCVACTVAVGSCASAMQYAGWFSRAVWYNVQGLRACLGVWNVWYESYVMT